MGTNRGDSAAADAGARCSAAEGPQRQLHRLWCGNFIKKKQNFDFIDLSFWHPSRSAQHHTARTQAVYLRCFVVCPMLEDAEWYLQSDAMPVFVSAGTTYAPKVADLPEKSDTLKPWKPPRANAAVPVPPRPKKKTNEQPSEVALTMHASSHPLVGWFIRLNSRQGIFAFFFCFLFWERQSCHPFRCTPRWACGRKRGRAV